MSTKLQTLSFTLSLLALVHCEPPVRGYHYEPNNYRSNSYNAPSNSYLPPKSSFNLPSSYLPPNSFTGSGHNYDNYQNNGHDYDHQHGHHHGNENEVVCKVFKFSFFTTILDISVQYGVDL
ncbi:unnamed protein product [Euphydryas editha]|uniref:Uncharacterized protein n=1 Tax=Euphydryas editha TaxID=104508 RepID=A0AAU9ULQ6_EUPED|nr:unnamed protein product [Euphydryas editha]